MPSRAMFSLQNMVRMLTGIAWEAKPNGFYQTTPPSDAGTVGGVGACPLFKKLPQGF